jgi:hypothetical protein
MGHKWGEQECMKVIVRKAREKEATKKSMT